LVSYLMEHQTGTTDDIRSLVDVPPEAGNSAWGAATLGLAQAGIIRKVGTVTSRRPERHGCEIKLWSLAVEHDAARRGLALRPEFPEPPPEDKGDAGAALVPSAPTPPLAFYQAVLF
jgi:hypothetical protein